MLQKKEPKVFIVRHGHTKLNGTSDTSVDRIRGWIDVPLNDHGREDAEDARKKLKGEHPSKIYTSDLCRAVETAEIVNKDFHVPITKDKNLRPWNLGVLCGRITSEVQDQMDNMVKHDNIVPKKGESFKAFHLRYLKELKKIMDEAIKYECTIFVFCHLRNLKTYEGWKDNGFPDDFSINANSMIKNLEKPGEVVEIDLKEYQNRKK